MKLSKNISSLVMIIFVLTAILSIGNNVKAASSDTTLKSLSIEPSGTGLAQDEENDKIYRVKVDNNITSVTVKAETNSPNATVSVSGNNSLMVGTNKVTVTVTAEDGNSANYIIYVRRADTPISGETIIPNVQDDNEQEPEENDNNDSKEENQEPENTIQNEEIINDVVNENVTEDIVNEEDNQIVDNVIENSENIVTNNESKMTSETIISIIAIVIVIAIIVIIMNKKR